MNCFYIDNGEEYITGASYLNFIGISIWVPAKKEVVTNKYRYKLDTLKNTIKPRIRITADNKRYLKLLDGICSLKSNRCDSKNPKQKFIHECVGIEIKVVIMS